MSVTIIINPVAGGARPDAARARAELASGILAAERIPGEVFVTERRSHARDLASAAVTRGARLVMAWGGDGTISEVASALAFSRTALGMIRAGSGNGLARELHVDARPERAIVEAVHAVPRRIDMGELDGRPFVNLAGIGFDAHVAAAFDDPGNHRRGLAKYASITARALSRYIPARYVITTSSTRIEASAILVTIANGTQFGNNARIAPGALVDDGRLDLVVVPERSRWRTLCHLPRLFNGTIARVPGCSTVRIEQVTIESDRPMLFHVDGEPVQGGARLDARVLCGALLVAVR